jgi:hypothetical protein
MVTAEAAVKWAELKDRRFGQTMRVHRCASELLVRMQSALPQTIHVHDYQVLTRFQVFICSIDQMQASLDCQPQRLGQEDRAFLVSIRCYLGGFFDTNLLALATHSVFFSRL